MMETHRCVTIISLVRALYLQTPLYLPGTSRHGPCTETCSIKVLLQCGAYASTQDARGITALHSVLVDAVQARGLRMADSINHFKRAHSDPKKDPR